jgi:SAM-dependent methyltransferase
MIVKYDPLAFDYREHRKPDASFAAKIDAHAAGAKSIINVGAGTGSYEPRNCNVIALEPSVKMILNRPKDAAKAIQGLAEHIPFQRNEFDIAMGILTIHHWQNLRMGLSEMKRVARQKIVLFTWVDESPPYWMEDYFPEMRAIDRRIFPTLAELESHLGKIEVEPVEIPGDCTDGFMCAYWKRPEAYLDSGVRAAISTFSRMKNTESGLSKLHADIESGLWRRTYGHLLDKFSLDLGYRLVFCKKEA